MRFFLLLLLAGAATLTTQEPGRAQAPGGGAGPPPTPGAIWVPVAPPGSAGAAPGATPAPPVRPSGAAPPGVGKSAADELTQLQQQLTALQGGPQAAGGVKQDDVMKKRVELLEQQVRILEKSIRLLAKQIPGQAEAGPAVEKLQEQTASLESRSRQAAARDRELADAVDDLREQRDADQRNGPTLPATLKELFLPTQTNETPLSIYSTFAFGFIAPQTGPQGFFFGEFSPDFYLKLNDWVFFEGEFSAGSNGSVSLTFASADFFINDWLTVLLGRFVAPIGWYNLRLNNPWVNKLPIDAPDTPLLWRQVLPTFTAQGIEAMGSHYICDSPIKLDYAAYVSNGLNLPVTAAPKLNDLANLENMENTFAFITDDKAVGGRVGLWWPEVGLAGGLSGLYNGSYIPRSEDAIRLWALDLNYHKGNWDARFEYGMTDQDTSPFLPHRIRRQGVNAQVAYRPRDACNKYLQNIEVVYRYGYVDFDGINPNKLTPSSFASPIDVPVRRQQHDFGIDYWISPRLVLQFAYEINDEFNIHLNDNQFIFEIAWGW